MSIGFDFAFRNKNHNGADISVHLSTDFSSAQCTETGSVNINTTCGVHGLAKIYKIGLYVYRG
jgi:hypothetical protein